MKRLILVILVALPLSLSANTMFISSGQVRAYQAANISSSINSTLLLGTIVEISETKDNWTLTNKGYIRTIFLSYKKPVQRFNILGSASSNALIYARKRAFSDVTAASARGLIKEKGDNIRQRDVHSCCILAPIEEIYISKEELQEFISKIK